MVAFDQKREAVRDADLAFHFQQGPVDEMLLTMQLMPPARLNVIVPAFSIRCRNATRRSAIGKRLRLCAGTPCCMPRLRLFPARR